MKNTRGELGNLSSSANLRLGLNSYCSFGDNSFTTSTGIGISSPHAETRMLSPPPQLRSTAAYYSGIILAHLHCLLFPKLFWNNPPRHMAGQADDSDYISVLLLQPTKFWRHGSRVILKSAPSSCFILTVLGFDVNRKESGIYCPSCRKLPKFSKKRNAVQSC